MKCHAPDPQPATLHDQPSGLSRREFLAGSALLALAALAPGCKTLEKGAGSEPIIDIHQHVGYSGRSDEVLLAHQRDMGVTTTILLPAGRPVNTASTHNGISNGLQAQALGNEVCYRFAKAHPKHYRFAACEVPDLPDAAQVIEKYLKLGGVCPRIGRSTKGAMRIGAHIGYRGMVREIVNYLLASSRDRPHLCATGGYARWAIQGLDMPFVIDPTLTLFGLGCILEKNGQPAKQARRTEEHA